MKFHRFPHPVTALDSGFSFWRCVLLPGIAGLLAGRLLFLLVMA